MLVSGVAARCACNVRQLVQVMRMSTLQPVAAKAIPPSTEAIIHPGEKLVDPPYMSQKQMTDYSNLPATVNPAVISQIAAKISSGYAESFFVCDLGQLRVRHQLWEQHLPRVQPFYAVKCNDDLRVLQTLASLGCGFDCASLKEIDSVLDLVADPARDIIFANPCKQQSHIEHARQSGVSLMTFDNEDEVQKIRALYPEAKGVIRLATDDVDAVCQLSCKFGAQPDEVSPLLRLAKSEGLDVVGVSFHCGSGNQNETVYVDAMDRASQAFQCGAQEGFHFTLLDIGGGFPGHTDEDHIFAAIAGAMTPYFDDFGADVRIIGEPGRFFAASIQTLASRVYSFKQQVDGTFVYYINDGVYGSFNNILYDHANPIPRKLSLSDVNAAKPDVDNTFPSTIYGPTCDGLDCIAKSVLLPKMTNNDWFFFENMGAYTNVGGSEFNGMPRPQFEYMDE